MSRTSEYPSLNELNSLNRVQLFALYKKLTGIPADKQTSSNLLRRNLSWDLQAGQEKFQTRGFHQRILKQLERGASKPTTTLQAGSRLIREWHGKVYEVTVLEKGYQWQGKTYRSLSPIAQMITGTKWSGPRFFGLKETKP